MPQKSIRVLIADSLSTQGIQLLKELPGFSVDVQIGLSPTDLAKIIANYEVLLVRSATQVTKTIIEAGKNLKLIGRAGIGVDNIDVPAATEAGILVMNSPQGNAATTAEHAIALLFALARHIPQANASLKSGKWEKSAFKGTEITNKVLGIIGLGNIGRIVAELGRGLRMHVIAYDPYITQEKALEIGVELATLEALYQKSDFISIHVPLLADTRNLLNAHAFQQMKKGVRIIQAARGGIINENDLLNALNNKTVAGAALDVFEQEPPPQDHPLIQHPNVIVTPHIAASTQEAQDRVALHIAEQTRDFFLHAITRNAVNR